MKKTLFIAGFFFAMAVSAGPAHAATTDALTSKDRMMLGQALTILQQVLDTISAKIALNDTALDRPSTSFALDGIHGTLVALDGTLATLSTLSPVAVTPVSQGGEVTQLGEVPAIPHIEQTASIESIASSNVTWGILALVVLGGLFFLRARRKNNHATTAPLLTYPPRPVPADASGTVQEA